MAKRDLKDTVENQYFKRESIPVAGEEGTREMNPLLPFIISGGKNTERYYFQHVSELTQYKFKVVPEYFGDEAQYTEVFPQRIGRIIEKNSGAKVYCVFDWDTVYGNPQREANHVRFKKVIEKYLEDGSVVLCPSMPSVEYWFLLHFEDCHDFLRGWREISQKLAPHIKSCFAYQSLNGIKFKDLLKREEYVKDKRWVEELCKDGKMELAMYRAESGCKDFLQQEGSELSYTFVYLIFKDYPM